MEASSTSRSRLAETRRPKSWPWGCNTIPRQYGVPATETVTAYNPVSGEVVWQHEHPSNSNISSAGNLMTAGDLIFQGSDTGEFCALDARNGRELFKVTVSRSIGSSPMTYSAKGKQYVAVMGSDGMYAFGLP